MVNNFYNVIVSQGSDSSDFLFRLGSNDSDCCSTVNLSLSFQIIFKQVLGLVDRSDSPPTKICLVNNSNVTETIPFNNKLLLKRVVSVTFE